MRGSSKLCFQNFQQFPGGYVYRCQTGPDILAAQPWDRFADAPGHQFVDGDEEEFEAGLRPLRAGSVSFNAWVRVE
jgi:hypothetical protein